jgi:hypothetical protein
MGFELIEILLMVHAAICALYFLIFMRNKMMRWLFLIVLFLPFLGIFLIIVIWIGSKMGKQDFEYEDDEVFLVDDKLEYISQLDDEKEMNVIPVQEALLVNDSDVQRSVVMEIAKRDPEKYIGNLKRALLSEDTETAHYAASSITELKRGYDKRLNEAQDAYEDDPSMATVRREYIEILNSVIIADLIIESIKKQHMDTIIDVLIYDIENSQIPLHNSYEMLCDYLINLQDFKRAKKWTDHYQKRYFRSDRPLRLKLKIAYETKDTKMFNLVATKIENAKFPITQKTMNILEFWGRGNKDE